MPLRLAEACRSTLLVSHVVESEIALAGIDQSLGFSRSSDRRLNLAPPAARSGRIATCPEELRCRSA